MCLRRLWMGWLLVCSFAVGSGPAWGQNPNTPRLTYQGRLLLNGSPLNGVFDLQFQLFTDLTGGKQVGGTIGVPDVRITNGLVSVAPNFGDVFADDARWLQVNVRPGASTGAYTPLAPRQPITAAPLASALVPHRKTIRLTAEQLSRNNFASPMDEGLIFPFNSSALVRAVVPMPPDWDRRTTVTVTLLYRLLDTPTGFSPALRFELRCTGRRFGDDLFASPAPLFSSDVDVSSGALGTLRRQRFNVPAARFLIGGASADIIHISSLRRVGSGGSPAETFSGGVILMALEIAYTGYR